MNLKPPSPRQHSSGRLISRYPPAQYRTTDGAHGIIHGAGLSKQIHMQLSNLLKAPPSAAPNRDPGRNPGAVMLRQTRATNMVHEIKRIYMIM
jgi:hypothetical protein